jgi:alanine dehydrogenase
MPATVARTSTQSLSSAIFPYVIRLAGLDLEAVAAADIFQDQALRHAVAIRQGSIVDEVLQQELSAPPGSP